MTNNNNIKNLLKSVLYEAQSVDLPITECPVCGKFGHPASIHQAKALDKENNQSVKEDTEEKEKDQFATRKPFKIHHHNPINQKGSLWKQLKKKWQIEGEIEPNCDDNNDNVDKKLLMEPGISESKAVASFARTQGTNSLSSPKEVVESLKLSTMHDSIEEAKLHKQTLENQGQISWINESPDGKVYVFWEIKEEIKPTMMSFLESLKSDLKKKQVFDKTAHIKALARTAIGQPKGKSVIKSKKDKPLKYKPRFDDF